MTSSPPEEMGPTSWQEVKRRASEKNDEENCQGCDFDDDDDDDDKVNVQERDDDEASTLFGDDERSARDTLEDETQQRTWEDDNQMNTHKNNTQHNTEDTEVQQSIEEKDAQQDPPENGTHLNVEGNQTQQSTRMEDSHIKLIVGKEGFFSLKQEDDDPLIIHELICERVCGQEVTRHWENNAQVWAAPLSTPTYLDLQYKLASTEVNLRRTAYWVLRKPHDRLTIISSCTTYARDAIVSQGSGAETTIGVIISNIFTHSQYRMKGMAKLLLKKVQEHLDKESEKSVFSVIFAQGYTGLYSELG